MFKSLKRFKLKSVQAGDGERSVDNVDAMTAAAQNRGVDPTGGGAPALFPPNYVKTDDEGRPPH